MNNHKQSLMITLDVETSTRKCEQLEPNAPVPSALIPEHINRLYFSPNGRFAVCLVPFHKLQRMRIYVFDMSDQEFYIYSNPMSTTIYICFYWLGDDLVLLTNPILLESSLHVTQLRLDHKNKEATVVTERRYACNGNFANYMVTNALYGDEILVNKKSYTLVSELRNHRYFLIPRFLDAEFEIESFALNLTQLRAPEDLAREPGATCTVDPVPTVMGTSMKLTVILNETNNKKKLLLNYAVEVIPQNLPNFKDEQNNDGVPACRFRRTAPNGIGSWHINGTARTVKMEGVQLIIAEIADTTEDDKHLYIYYSKGYHIKKYTPAGGKLPIAKLNDIYCFHPFGIVLHGKRTTERIVWKTFDPTTKRTMKSLKMICKRKLFMIKKANMIPGIVNIMFD